MKRINTLCIKIQQSNKFLMYSVENKSSDFSSVKMFIKRDTSSFLKMKKYGFSKGKAKKTLFRPSEVCFIRSVHCGLSNYEFSLLAPLTKRF